MRMQKIIFLALMVCVSATTQAANFQFKSVNRAISSNQLSVTMVPQAPHKTEITIVNDSDKMVVVEIDSFYMDCIVPGFSETFYSDEQEYDLVPLGLRVLGTSNYFYKHSLTNHSVLYTKRFIPK